jgi:uncharacterized protein YjbI with pentapeptide repeats
MLGRPTADYREAMERFAKLCMPPVPLGVLRLGGGLELPTLDVQGSRFVLCQADQVQEIKEAFTPLPDSFDEAELFEIIIAAEGLAGNGAVLGRGVRALSAHSATARLIGLPSQGLIAQQRLLEQVLQSLKIQGSYEISPLRLRIGGEQHEDAAEWLTGALSWEARRMNGRLLYLRSEAGKGKSTVFAEVAKRLAAARCSPLPLYVPLRRLERGGASWDRIAESIGVVGSGCIGLSAAARSGLVSVLLDGLDEVAGRYDPTVVSEVLNVVVRNLVSPNSLIALSGRTTEATLLDKTTSIEATLELPPRFSAAFSRYTSTVVDLVTPSWPEVAARLPEPSIVTRELPSRRPSDVEKATIKNWIELVFDELGKERSLFFIQSLACIGRTLQLEGNQPLVIEGRPRSPVQAYDVCVLAAALACVREQDKVEAIAQGLFEPRLQLRVLSRLALHASSDAETNARLPTPNAEAQSIFRIDPLNQNEEFTAIVRQLQKHALLFARGESLSAGDWRPQFLSDWIRSALLVRAWLDSASEAAGERQLVRAIVARAQKAGLAFSVLFPETARTWPATDLQELVDAVVKEANLANPEATSNFWALISGLADPLRAQVVARPNKVVEMADLSALEFESIRFGREFSANLAVAVGVACMECEFEGCKFTQTDLTKAVFEGCELRDCSFEYCDGVMRFENCSFRDVRFLNSRTQELPALIFRGCVFGSGCEILQREHAGRPEAFGPIAMFESCTWNCSNGITFEGEWLGFSVREIAGLCKEPPCEKAPGRRCLAQLLRPFFPSHVGSAEERQARGYIRLSALGRGAMPDGAPSPADLKAILEAEGFTDGGRSDHMYAPWSSVAGAGKEAVALRNELLGFIRNGTGGEAVQRMLARLERKASWVVPG